MRKIINYYSLLKLGVWLLSINMLNVKENTKRFEKSPTI